VPDSTSAPGSTAGTTSTTPDTIATTTKTAPDFVLTLSDGTDYSLSSETRPVYLVFWAEW
jgi:hypothetical protein